MEDKKSNCIICNKDCNPKNERSISRHILYHHNITLSEYYDMFYKEKNEDICVICNNKNQFINLSGGYKEYCSNKCRLEILKREQEFKHDKWIKSLENPQSCNICKKIFNGLAGVANHVNQKHDLTIKDYYDKYLLKNEAEKYCVVCNKKTSFYTIIDGYLECCSQECVHKNSRRNEQSRKTIIEIFKNPIKKKEIIDKRENTCKERYNVRNPLMLDKSRENQRKAYKERGLEIQDKKVTARKEKYGDGTFNNREKARETYFIKTGYENPGQNPEVKERMADTCEERYGERNPMRVPEIREKMIERNQLKYGVDWYQQTKEWREEQSIRVTEAIIRGERNFGDVFNNGHFFSTKNNKELYYRSSYELTAYKILENDNNVLNYKTEPLRIPYTDTTQNENITRNYVPDLLVTYTNNYQELIEIKPSCFLDNELVKLKTNAGYEYCNDKELKFNIWTEEQLEI